MKAKLSSASGSKAGTPPKPSAGGQQGARAPGGAASSGPLAVQGANGPGPAGGAAPADQRSSLPPLTPEEMRRQYAGACSDAAAAGRLSNGRPSPGASVCTAAGRGGAPAARRHSSPTAPLPCLPAPADSLPLLRDVPPHEKQALFVRKLHLCAFSFDFTGALFSSRSGCWPRCHAAVYCCRCAAAHLLGRCCCCCCCCCKRSTGCGPVGTPLLPCRCVHLRVSSQPSAAAAAAAADPAAHVREKEIKRQTLLELVDYVNSGSGKFTEQVRQWMPCWQAAGGVGTWQRREVCRAGTARRPLGCACWAAVGFGSGRGWRRSTQRRRRRLLCCC